MQWLWLLAIAPITFAMGLLSLTAVKRRPKDIAVASETMDDTPSLSKESDGDHPPKKKDNSFFADCLTTLKSPSFDKVLVVILSTVLACFAGYEVLTTSVGVIRMIRTLLVLEMVVFAGVYDLYTKKIPNYISLCGVCFGGLCLIAEGIFCKDEAWISLIACVCASVITFVILLVMSLLTRGGLGMGDVKLVFTMTFLGGVVLTVYSLLIGMVICMIVSVFLLIFRHSKLKDEIPFGPFLALGYVAAILIGKL